MSSFLTPMTESCGPGHAEVGDVRRAAGQHARVVRLDVRVRAEDGGRAACEVPAHRDLLAGRLGVHVHDQDRAGLQGLAHQAVDDLERGARRLQGQAAQQVQHRHRRPVPRRHRQHPAARQRAQVVGGTHHPLRRREVGARAVAAPRVVAERQAVDARRQQARAQPRRDARAAGHVLAVRQHEVEVELVAQRGHVPLDGVEAGIAEDVAEEEDAHHPDRGTPGRGPASPESLPLPC